jgi:hypothetical protein
MTKISTLSLPALLILTACASHPKPEESTELTCLLVPEWRAEAQACRADAKCMADPVRRGDTEAKEADVNAARVHFRCRVE